MDGWMDILCYAFEMGGLLVVWGGEGDFLIYICMYGQ